MPGADQHHGRERQRQAEQPGRPQMLALHQTDADRQHRRHQCGDRGQHVHRADCEGLAEQGERGGRRHAVLGASFAPGDGGRGEGGTEHGPQQQLEGQRSRGRDHHRAQDMGFAGTQTAEKIGASIGQRTAEGQQQSEHR
ncbi:hypothetical protein AMK14_33830 [Streptomyces sp. TSRI0445]|nr:hypothetical protein [Streptomyces sp. TSRI0445]OKI61899.1 hypothetical protein AMK14_33830 [Streptomyces sp. TSRI0445]